MLRRLVCTAFAALCLGALTPAFAAADTGDIIAPQNQPPTAADGWQAGTCTVDPCSPETPELFYTQASGHPPFGFTQFIIKHTTAGPLETPVGTLKNVRVDLPAGLSVNPQATPQCPLADFEALPASCAASAVGASIVTTSLGGIVAPPLTFPVYNLVPNEGEPALFGFEALGSDIFLKADVDWSGDYHEGFTIAVPTPPLGAKILKNRLAFSGVAGNGTFLTNPPTCNDPAQPQFAQAYSTFAQADSVEVPDPSFPTGSTRFEAPLPPGIKPTGCENVPFEPGLKVEPGTAQTDSPDGATVEATVPFKPGDPIANSNVKTARQTLPVGQGLNPSAATGLVFCTDEQFGKGTRNEVTCPAASKVGTVAVETPPLPPGSLTGDVYLGTQKSRDPASGNVYRILIRALSKRYGVDARLVGNVAANPATGQLTTTLADNPQVPFTSFKLKFNSGERAPLSSPPTCGPNRSLISADPYSGRPAAEATTEFTLTEAAGGGPCAKTMAERPFKPGFSARSQGTTAAGAYSPFVVSFSRTDGQQELKGADLTLPAGVTGKLKGVPYCSPQEIAAAAGRAGDAEAKNPSCPANSRVGVATIKSGTGPAPIELKGDAYLAGPYKGAPLSLAVMTPAVAGPFDLGVVVVRVALFVEPETARIRPVADPIPDVYGGAKLSIRQIVLNTNKKDFTINPTSCNALETAGALAGGGSDPANPAAFSSFPVSAPYQTTDCKKLKFRPKLGTKILSGRKSVQRAQNPKFRATMTARNGDANLKGATVVLPRPLILDQAHIKTLCTRPQQAANTCPKNAIYGRAVATSPLLGQKLKGPVFLVPSDNILPDLMVDLRGQVNVRLRASVETVKGRMKNTFYRVPDVPVSKFVLTMKGGKKGLLTPTSDLCARKQFSKMNLRAQNGKKLKKKKLKLQIPACNKKKGKGKGGK